MKTQIIIAAEQRPLQFTRKNLGFPVPRRTSDQDVNEDTQERDVVENEEGTRGEEPESQDENARIKDGFESQDDRF